MNEPYRVTVKATIQPLGSMTLLQAWDSGAWFIPIRPNGSALAAISAEGEAKPPANRKPHWRRRAMLLRYLSGEQQKEIAASLDLSSPAVWSGIKAEKKAMLRDLHELQTTGRSDSELLRDVWITYERCWPGTDRWLGPHGSVAVYLERTTRKGRKERVWMDR